MNGAKATARRSGSSFGPGPRRGTDPEGGERSAWKGLCGPSGLNLDHSRIPEIQTTVYEVLLPRVVAAGEPIPLSQFTQKCCDLLLPVLERQQELGAHEFKSQWGRLNEFVAPELARRAGLGDSGYSREHKTVRIDLNIDSSSSSTPAQRAGHGTASAAKPLGLPTPGPSAAAPAPPAAAGVPSPPPGTACGMPAALPPQPGAMPLPMPLPGSLMPPPLPPCAYCQGLHSMKHCRDFHTMLQSIYQAGYSQGMTAAQQQMQAQAQAAAPAPAATYADGSSALQ